MFYVQCCVDDAFIFYFILSKFPFCRMLVYEYVDNGNLEQWLHGDVGPCSPLTWEIRMNIILGTAKGYLLNQQFEAFFFSFIFYLI